MGRSKSEKWRLIWPFFSILVVHGIAIFIFTRGFLLTRTELPHSSNCSDVNQSSCFRTSPSPGGNSTGGGCWTKPSVGRVVIIVFDALRFDFVAPSTFFQDKKPWMDKLQVMHKLAADPGSSSRIFKAIADPPTTSLQRLKGLTTGGLPTFIDVGNSFGAPAIIEDNLIQQLVKNGRRVVMMGDDTWLQLFPHHFDKSFPYPSFNVKDLDTVDNGCIQHLLPSLTEGDWDVLIAHFLGVDHAGHIFGVNTAPMIQKLEQYNNILEDVIDVLSNQSGPGDLHENTFLLVMGDHGQTLNGDHGGGSPEEVETSIFAKSFRRLSSSILTELDSSSCGLNMDGKQVCISTIEQIDFAATVSAMLGIPSPFGSIGRVNSQLYALAAGTWPEENAEVEGGESHAYKNWMLQYANVLCINAWQVKRYIDVYSASSVIGFSSADLLHVANLYSEAQLNWSKFIEAPSSPGENYDQSLLTLKIQIDAYLKYLDGVIDLARSKWTEFDLKLMGLGFSILLVSLLLQLVAIKKVNDFCGSSVISWHKQAPAALIFSLFVAVMRASSFLSNSYILEEGKVAMYFLGTLWILEVRYSISKKKMLLEAALLIVLLYVLRVSLELGLSKQVATGSILDLSLLLGSTPDHPGWKYFITLVSTIAVISLGLILLKISARRSQWQFQEYLAMGNSFNFILLAVHWAMESELLSVHIFHDYIQKDYIARLVYVIGSIQVVTLALGPFFIGEKMLDHHEHLSAKSISMVSAWIPTIILLSGRQGALIGVLILVAAWCITKLENLREGVTPDDVDAISFYSRPVTEWSLLAVSLFFCTGHWCAFDGLRYAAAFIGFDEFNLIRQAILLSIETFGFSHILPILGLPLLVSRRALNRKENPHILFAQLSQVFLMYGFITATAATFTVLCVTIHRRHLMVWGLFAPKFVFEALGLMLTDVLICLSALYYINPVEK